MTNKIKLLRLKNYPILKQLHLEEALLRSDNDNWCLINEGTPAAVVMGRTQKIDEVVNLEEMERQNLSLIRRFSGGGCVVVDTNTIFFTLIMGGQMPSPQNILDWTHQLLIPAFQPLLLRLETQDFVINDRKIGGNAQSIIKNRFMQHTSFLWSWEQERMKALLHPPKEPSYRQGRRHDTFLGKLQDHFASKQFLIEQIFSSLLSHFHIEEVSQETIHLIQQRSYTMNTKVEYERLTTHTRPKLEL